MRISIERVTQLPSGDSLITFVAQFGTASGKWAGPPPGAGNECDVELEIPGPLKWGDDICEVDNGEPAIFQRGEATYIVGRLQAMNEDGIAEVTLRDAVVVVEVSDGGCKPPCDVLIKTSNLQLFDANI